MLEKFISYFTKRHLLANLIFISVFIGGIFAWNNTSKEELPDITFDRVRISVSYPGAPAEDVEYFVTKPIEEVVRGLDGVYRVTSTTSVGQSNINIEIEQNYPDIDQAVTEIRNTVLDVNLPTEVIDDPDVRVFKTSKKAIIDIALYDEDIHLLNPEQRRELQKYAFALESQLLNLPQVNSVNRRGYLDQELQIKVYPEKLLKYQIPFNTAMNEIKSNHVRKPAGNIENAQEPQVSLVSELDSPEKLRSLIIQGGFEGQVVRLGEVASITEGFEKTKEIRKVNGRQAVILNVVKNSSYGIIEAIDAVKKAVKDFEKNNLQETSLKVVLLDDESIDIRNRLSLIALNGSLGFILVVLILFLFLSRKAGLWVAMGIPFTLCFTAIAAPLMGQTINGMTLAAIIIVMGIIVDDAIVVAENITRLSNEGMAQSEAVVKGTAYVILPVLASIITTCVAFIPLYFFTGHFGKFIQPIPTIIFLVLAASFVESIFILPGHMNLKFPFLSKLSGKRKEPGQMSRQGHWFEKIEDKYGRFIEKVLLFKGFVFLAFVVLFIISGLLIKYQFKFVMFPHEETRDIMVSGKIHEGAKRFETAQETRRIEDIILRDFNKELVGVSTDIARSRRGGAVEENNFRISLEIVSKEKRKKSADQIVEKLKKEVEGLEGFEKLNFSKSRWGQSSGSAIELLVQQNNDAEREAISQDLKKKLQAYPSLENVEIDGDMRIDEYRIDIDRDKAKRLSINSGDIASTFRAALEGNILYEFTGPYEDIQTRFSIVDSAKGDIEEVLSLPVENKGNYLVPLRDVVHVEKTTVLNSITREDLKRTTTIDADLKKKHAQTPLEIAQYFEKEVFPGILKKYPMTTLSFTGEVESTRESKADLASAIILVLLLIYVVLAVLFNSLIRPLIIMLSIPFGMIGIILAFWLHGKVLFGFFAAIGALGLAGVVVNDSIIMLVKLDREYKKDRGKEEASGQIANIAKTRLRAVVLTTLTTVAGILPTAYGFAGYDAMLAEMMLALAWGLMFGTLITLILIPCIYSFLKDFEHKFKLSI
ncbi:MAG: efflux RND transporter permease subunit [Candidatus Aceula meridiana]|nr:efflux RND transporter permease subunit [Candidatus Aceula meridiana]